ncbi:MAG: hypothetical protein AAGI52_14860 [Bacteroidota bacterium]
MQQTILALAAILIFSLYAMSRHQADASRERLAITAEVETAAVGIARTRMHEITLREFDEADIGREGARSSLAGLTATSSFGPDMGETTEATYDDIDDFDGRATPQTVQWNGRNLVFRDSVSVRYVVPATAAASAGATLAKEVTIIVTAAPDGFIGTPEVAARLRRIVTPASSTSLSTS